MKISSDDPRLTAFALGELAGDEHASIAAAVAADPALRAVVEEINRAASQLATALASEPLPVVEPIELPIAHPASDRTHARPRARLFEFPYVAIGSLAAACFAIALILLRQDEPGLRRIAALEAVRSDRVPAVVEPEDVPVVALREKSSPAPETFSESAPPIASNPASTVPASTVATAATTTPAIPSTDTNPVVPTAPVVEETPTPATYAFRQVAPATPEAAGGVVHTGRGESAAASRSHVPASAPTFPGTVPFNSPTGVAQAGPASSAAAATGATNADDYQELLGSETATSERLRTTFGDFGASRYRRNNPAGATNAPTAAGERRASDENTKTSPPVGQRVAFAEPIATGVALRDERDNGFVAVGKQPASVFPIVIASSSLVSIRRALLAGNRPARDIVRIEEMLSRPSWDYAAPFSADGTTPFAATLEVASAPWQSAHRLVRVGLKAREVPATARPAANLVLLIETANTSAADSRLALIKESLQQLVSRLASQDQVALAVHSAGAMLLLPTTSASDRETIQSAIERVQSTGAAGGTTGLQLAYDIARAHFIPSGINRVILFSDGDTRIGIDRRDVAVRLIAAQAAAGVSLSALGYGVRDIRESTFEYLAHRGRSDIACVDSLRDVQHALLERGICAFTTVARHVKVQVEFNPAQVAAWRLIGYEDRGLPREDFDDESLTAEAIGAGHTVTALFEVIAPPPMAPAAANGAADRAVAAEMLSVKVRYALPGDDTARLQQFALTDHAATFDRASADFKLAAAIAGYGMILRESSLKGSATLADVVAWARAGQGTDADGFRDEFIDLVERTSRIAQ